MAYEDYNSDYAAAGSYDEYLPQPSKPHRSLRKIVLVSVGVIAGVVVLSFGLFAFLNDGGKTSSRANVMIREVNFAQTATKPGGAYFDLLAQFMEGVGEILGAVYDPGDTRLVLVFEKSAALPPLKVEDFAVAIKNVFSNKVETPAASIDPDPKNPLADSMHVKFYGEVANTHFGWVMLEADRKMKAYSLGRDNLTKAKVRANVPEYYNLLQLSFSNLAGRNNPGLWSRFWLYPRSAVVRVSDDWNSIYFAETQIGVRTETMRWQGGQLVPAGNMKDQKAEYFANHFTNYYDAFAREEPIYAELRRQMQLLAIAEWMKEIAVSFDPYWVEFYGKTPYAIPKKTPSLKVDTTGARQTVRIFGGTDMFVEPLWAKDDGRAESLKNLVKKNLPADQSRPSFDVQVNGKPARAVIFPGVNTRATGSFVQSATDLTVETNGHSLALTRYHSPSQNERSPFGCCWTMNLPRLHAYNPQRRRRKKDGAIEYGVQTISVDGIPGSEVEVKKFVLYDELGSLHGIFGEPKIDQARKRVFFPCLDNDDISGLYPQQHGAYEIIFRDGRKMIFGRDGLIQKESNGATEISYEYWNNRLHRMARSPGGDWIELQYDENGLIKKATGSDGQSREYAYDENARLRTEASYALELRFGPQRVARVNVSARELLVDETMPLDQPTRDLLTRFYEKYQAEFLELLAKTGANQSVFRFFDCGAVGYVFFAENKLQARAVPLREVKRELLNYWKGDRTQNIDALNDVLGEKAGEVLSRNGIFNSTDKEMDAITALYLRLNGKRSYLDDRLDIALKNLIWQDKLDKREIGVIIDDQSFEKSPARAKLKQGAVEIEKTLREQGVRSISHDFSQPPPESNILIITAENDGELSEKLQKLGKQLENKMVVIFSCGDMNNLTRLPETAHQMVERYGCRGVVSFYEKIDITAVQAVMKELIAVIRENPAASMEDILDQAIQKARQANAENQAVSDNLNTLIRRWHQISFENNHQREEARTGVA